MGGRRLDAERVDDEDVAGGIDVGIDVGRPAPGRGVGRAQPAPGPGRMKWLAGPGAAPVHYLILAGDGRPLPLTLVKPPGPARGALAVAIYPLGPPPALGPAVDLVRVPVQKDERRSRHVPGAGEIYVLEAAGVGGVGGGGLKVGDAEYMDFAADGSGRNEGEAGVDFGIGVDEPAVRLDLPQGSAHPQRRLWWGPFRGDHVYYVLYAGTGKPVSFTYHDTGYGDNSRTAALVVRLYRAP